MLILQIALGVLLAIAIAAWWPEYRLRRAERRGLKAAWRNDPNRWRPFKRALLDFSVGLLVVAAIAQTVIKLMPQ